MGFCPGWAIEKQGHYVTIILVKKLVLAYPNATIIIWFFLICIENDCLCCIAKCKAVL